MSAPNKSVFVVSTVPSKYVYEPPPTPVCLSYQHKKFKHNNRPKDDSADEAISSPDELEVSPKNEEILAPKALTW